MIIEDTINEIGEFISKLLNTFRLLLFTPRKLLIYIKYSRYATVLGASVFFLIAYFGFLCISFTTMRTKGIGDRLTFDQLVINLKHITENLTEVERFLYLAALLVVIYYSNVLLSYLLFVPKKERKKFQQFVLYYISLSIVIFIFLELLQLFLGEKLNASLLNGKLISYDGASVINHLAYYLYLCGKYVVAPLIYVYAVTHCFYKNKPVFVRYALATVCIIFVADYVIWISKGVALLVDPKEYNIQLKGSMLGDNKETISYGRIQPVFLKDSLKKMITLSINIYVCNNTDSAIVVPQNDTLFLRAESDDDLQKFRSALEFEPGSWEPFDNRFILKSSLFDNKADRYGLVKPSEIKLVTFSRVFQQKDSLAAYQSLFAAGCALTSRLKVYEPSTSTLVSKQQWVILPLTQRLFLSGKTKCN